MEKYRKHPRLDIRIEKETKINLAKIKKKLDVDWNRLMEILINKYKQDEKRIPNYAKKPEG